MTYYITQMFYTGSPELEDYLKEHSVGAEYATPDGKKWTVMKVTKSYPPNISNPDPQTVVSLEIHAPNDVVNPPLT
jgi:hypothetical protein